MQLRSRSSERPAAVIRSVPNSPAREKRRARSDRIVPLLPNQQQKLKSYEIGTQSSRAKLHPRVDTPPSSPHKLYKKKRSLLNELKDSKNKPNSAKDKVETVSDAKSKEKVVESNVPLVSVKPCKTNNQSFEIMSDPSSHASLDSLETEDKAKFVEMKSEKMDTTSSSKSKEEKDRIAMPPPVSIRVAKTRTGHKSGEDSKKEEKRKEPESKKPKADKGAQMETQSSESEKSGVSNESPCESEKSVSDESPCVSEKSVSDKSPSEENKELPLSPVSDISSSPPSINGHDIALNGHDSAESGHNDVITNGHDSSEMKGHAEEDKSENVVSMNGHDADGEQTLSAGTVSPLGSTCDSIPDDILTESATELSESASIPTSDRPVEGVRRKMSLDLPSSPKGKEVNKDQGNLFIGNDRVNALHSGKNFCV